MLERSSRKHSLHNGKWNGLGGKMELGESPEECVVREVREESGLSIREPRLKGVLTFPGFDGDNDWIVFLFEARKFSGKIVNSREGRVEWVIDKQVFNLALWEGDRYFLRWMQGKKFFTAKFIYKDFKLKSHSVCYYA